MRTILAVVMALGLGVVGCGNNECEDAADRLDECGFDLGESTPDDDETNECNKKDECSSKCVNAGSCADIKGWKDGEENSFSTCMAACPVK
ncbi:MAG TPA: hypothetical protein VIW29_03720 [Polyangiaceae bacterium]